MKNNVKMNVACKEIAHHQCKQIFKEFSGGTVGDFSKIFQGGGAKSDDICFFPLETRKQPFFAGNFKIQGIKAPLFPTPM